MFGLVIQVERTGLAWPGVSIKRVVTTGYGGLYPICRATPWGPR